MNELYRAAFAVALGVCLSARAAEPDVSPVIANPEPAPASQAAAGAPPPEAAAPPEVAGPPEPAPPIVPPAHQTVIRARRPHSAASATSVKDRDFLLRPTPRPADILQAVPGFYVVQHAGGGKANQYFLRGFDADHGTDVALSVDGVPVNLVSHGHGQGFADLNWIIPELIHRVDVQKGPYFAERGDFATAGAVDLVTYRSLQESALTLSGGSFDTWRALVIASPHLESTDVVLAGQAYGTNGPFLSEERLQRYSLEAHATRQLGSKSRLTVAATGYASGWNASGQLPLRAVEAGTLDRFGSVDPNEGGSSARESLSAIWTASNEAGDLSVTAYAVHYRFDLFSDFTFFSEDPIAGDMIEQTDDRLYGGLDARWRFYREWAGIGFDTTFGTQLRSDAIDNALYKSPARQRVETKVDARIREVSVGLFASEEVTLTPALRLYAGLRADHFDFQVTDRLGPEGTGTRQASLVSPKASLVYAVHPTTELFANFGSGFHSNDARGVVRHGDPVTPLTPARGYELGARSFLFDRLDVSLDGFLLDLDSEIVWVGDEGTTEARGPTRRLGVEAAARWRIFPWLTADADATWTRARFTGGPERGSPVALAPTFITSGGIAVTRAGFFGRAGALHIANRPATEDRALVAEGFTRVDLLAGYKTSWFEVSVGVQNLLDTKWREAQFANTSRLQDEAGPEACPAGTHADVADGYFAGCEDVHFTPGAPRNFQVSASLFF